MKRYLIRAVPGTVLAGLVLLSGASLAFPPAGGHEPGQLVEHIADRLELDDSQRAEVEQLTDASRAQMTADHQRLGEIREQLRAQRENFDAGTAQQLADELGEVTARITYTMTSTHAQVYALLTDEQRAQLDADMERRQDMIARWREHRGKRNH